MCLDFGICFHKTLNVTWTERERDLLSMCMCFFLSVDICCGAPFLFQIRMYRAELDSFAFSDLIARLCLFFLTYFPCFFHPLLSLHLMLLFCKAAQILLIRFYYLICYCFVCCVCVTLFPILLLLLLFRLNCNVSVCAQAMILYGWKLDIIACHWVPRVCIENIIEALISQITRCIYI